MRGTRAEHGAVIPVVVLTTALVVALAAIRVAHAGAQLVYVHDASVAYASPTKAADIERASDPQHPMDGDRREGAARVLAIA
jgi:hypothetical protein